MAPNRYSTVHDLAALRLHPDGTRVQNTDKNLTLRQGKHSIRDTRGNWIARDAGGVGTVKQRRAGPRDRNDGEDAHEGESFDLSNVDGDEEGSPSVIKGKGRAAEEPLRDPRAKKRRRFFEDLSFLATHSDNRDAAREGKPQTESLSQDDTVLPPPSSDLLKTLHYFASTYYSAMGQLYDASREVRKAKRARHTEQADLRATSSGRGQAEVAENSIIPDENEDEGEARSRSRSRSRRRGQRSSNPDMYKMCDGSALMAIGMFFQEYVKQLVITDIPEGWEDEVNAIEEASNRRSRSRYRKKINRSSDEMPDPDARNDDDIMDEGVGSEDSEETNRRQTRGVVLPVTGNVPYPDVDSGDGDYVPE